MNLGGQELGTKWAGIKLGSSFLMMVVALPGAGCRGLLRCDNPGFGGAAQSCRSGSKESSSAAKILCTNSRPVNWLPWSVLQISGLACSRAQSMARRTKSTSRLWLSCQPTTNRENRSSTATRYSQPWPSVWTLSCATRGKAAMRNSPGRFSACWSERSAGRSWRAPPPYSREVSFRGDFPLGEASAPQGWAMLGLALPAIEAPAYIPNLRGWAERDNSFLCCSVALPGAVRNPCERSPAPVYLSLVDSQPFAGEEGIERRNPFFGQRCPDTASRETAPNPDVGGCDGSRCSLCRR